MPFVTSQIGQFPELSALAHTFGNVKQAKEVKDGANVTYAIQ